MDTMNLQDENAVIISCFSWFDRRLYFPYQKLAEVGYRVSMLASDFEHVNKKARTDDKGGKITLIHVPRYTKNVSAKRLYSHMAFSRECSRILKKLKPDLIYAVVPPNSVGKVVADYKKKNPKTKLIVDVVDMWPESFPVGALKRLKVYNYWKNMRTNALRLSDLIVLECNYYKDVLDADCKNKCETLYLMKNQEPDAADFVKHGIKSYTYDKSKINLCYLGSMNSIIDIDSICQVIKALCGNGKHVTLRIIGKGESKESFMTACSDSGAEVIDCGTIYDEIEKAKLLLQSDFGLNMMKKSVKVGLTLKSMDYLSAGLPIINNIKGDTWLLVDDKNVGFNYNNNDAQLVEWIDSYNKNTKSAVYDVFSSTFKKEGFENTFADILKRHEII